MNFHRLGAWCARRVLPFFERLYPEDLRPRQAIEVLERFVVGAASAHGTGIELTARRS